jgi:NAD(P)-dependent dehydrogenase (short-subunit alcohol dehydrogenase family)
VLEGNFPQVQAWQRKTKCSGPQNYLGHFLLTMLLVDKLHDCDQTARIVNLTSMTHIPIRDVHYSTIHAQTKEYHPITTYASSKFAIALFTHALARKLAGTNIIGKSTARITTNDLMTNAFRSK